MELFHDLHFFAYLLGLNEAAVILLLGCARIVLLQFVSPWTAGWGAVITPQGLQKITGAFPTSEDDVIDESGSEISNNQEQETTYVTQYIAQDELGYTSFGYAHPGQAATNYRDPSGTQIGNWAYTTPEGKKVVVAYIADSRGFRAFSDDLPVAPSAVNDTVEVTAARAQHLVYHQQTAKGKRPTAFGNLPESQTETADVAAARAEHLASHQLIKNRRRIAAMT